MIEKAPATSSSAPVPTTSLPPVDIAIAPVPLSVPELCSSSSRPSVRAVAPAASESVAPFSTVVFPLPPSVPPVHANESETVTAPLPPKVGLDPPIERPPTDIGAFTVSVEPLWSSDPSKVTGQASVADPDVISTAPVPTNAAEARNVCVPPARRKRPAASIV